MKWLFFSISIFFYLPITAQYRIDVAVQKSVLGIKIFPENDQLSLPVIQLGGNDKLELHFDDSDYYVKNYYYTFQLCNADWSVADVSPFDYINGYQQQRISQYRYSSLAISKYVHYQVLLPENNCIPSKSGNYLLKVFLNGDTSQLAFTKRFYVVNDKAVVAARITQPFNQEQYSTHQKLQMRIALQANDILNVSQQVKVTVLQNYRYDNAITNVQPAFIRNNVLEYNGEDDFVFEGGKEYRWADVRSFRFLSERIDAVNNQREVFLKPDFCSINQPYIYIKDYNGFYFVGSADGNNTWWQTEYGSVHFTFVPPNNQPYQNKDVFITGELVNNQINEQSKMEYNAAKGVYEKNLYLKQGYYNYNFVTKDIGNRNVVAKTALTQGNYWETENDYTILVYYRSVSSRYDELIALHTFNSRLNMNINF
jgi:hypothetical protein